MTLTEVIKLCNSYQRDLTNSKSIRIGNKKHSQLVSWKKKKFKEKHVCMYVVAGVFVFVHVCASVRFIRYRVSMLWHLWRRRPGRCRPRRAPARWWSARAPAPWALGWAARPAAGSRPPPAARAAPSQASSARRTRAPSAPAPPAPHTHNHHLTSILT